MKAMKRNILAIVMMAVLLTLTCTAHAVEYKTTYTGRKQQPAYMYSAASTAPVATFRSTSAYSGQWSQTSQTSMLNSDGSVNTEAYGMEPSNPAGKHLRKITNPDGEDDDDVENPLGDGLLALLLCALLYIIRVRKHKERLAG